MTDERGFELALMERLGEREEVENVGVLERLLGELRLRGGERDGEVGDGTAVPRVCPRSDLEGEDVAGPAVCESLFHVPTARCKIFDLLHDDDVVRPRNCPERC